MPPKSKSTDALKHGAIYASVGGAFVAAGPVVTDDHGLPRRRFVKDLIRVGEWYAGDTKHPVTQERIDGWAAKFGQMAGKGVDVPAPIEHTSDPKERRGTVRSMWVEGDTLMGEFELVGEDALRMAACGTKVSIYAPPSVQAGDGTKWSDAIEHVCLTDYPVVSGQKNFIPIAASKGEPVNVPVLLMAKESNMLDWKKVAAAIKFDVSGLDDTTGPAKVEEALNAFTTAAADATGQVATLTASLKTANDQVTAMSKTGGKMPEVDPDIISARTETVGAKLEALVLAGKLTPAALTLAKTKLTTGTSAGVCLSGKAATAVGLSQPVADIVIDILSANEPKDLKAGVDAQRGTQLSRSTPGDQHDQSKPNAAVIDRVTAAMGIKS
jgi:hypothetical protein